MATKIFERLEAELAGDEKEELKRLVDKVGILQNSTSDRKTDKTDGIEEPSVSAELLALENVYIDLQTKTIELRQAIAHGIASEKAIEAQIQKSSAQAETWRKRVDQAQSQENMDLADQARSRMNDYEQMRLTFEKALLAHSGEIANFRKGLSDVEQQLMKAWAAKMTLSTRDKFADAAAQMKALFKEFDSESVTGTFRAAEIFVREKEVRVAALKVSSNNSNPANSTLSAEALAQSIQSLETTLEALRALAKEHAKKQVE